MFAKFHALAFLFKCTVYIAWQLLLGKNWHMLSANIEVADGRHLFTYKKTIDGFELQDWLQPVNKEAIL